MKRLAVVGTGYVGLVSGAMFASVGNHVTCVDKDPLIVNVLRAGTCTIHEPGLDEILDATIADGTLNFTTELLDAVRNADATFIAVGTPSQESGAYDFQYVEAAAREIAQAIRGQAQHIVVLKSTVTPDIYTRVQEILTEGSGGVECEVVSNPEFLAEGTAVRDFREPHRVIVGAVSPAAQEFMEALYAPFTRRKPGLLQFTDPRSAIVTKLAANSFLACRVALINELARYCDNVGADIEHVRTGLASDPRIGHLFLYAGPGYGGSCFGKDIRALRESAREHGTDLSLVPAIEESNDRQKLDLPGRSRATSDRSRTRSSQFGDLRSRLAPMIFASHRQSLASSTFSGPARASRPTIPRPPSVRERISAIASPYSTTNTTRFVMHMRSPSLRNGIPTKALTTHCSIAS